MTKNKKKLPYANKGDLTTGSVAWHMTRLTVPMIWGLFAIISVQLVDTYFISTLGHDELVGISFTFPVTMLLTHLFFGFNISVASVASRLIGEKKTEDVSRVVLHSVLSVLVISSFVAMGVYLVLEPAFRALGADETSMVIIMQYMPIWLMGFMIFTVISNGNSAIRAGGDTVIPGITMSCVALVNLIFDPILIYGWFGFPALGIQGAAIATVLGYFTGLSISMYTLFFHKKLIHFKHGLQLELLSNSMKRLLVIAIPAGLANIIVPATNAIIIRILASYGEVAVAGYGVVSRVEAFALIAVMAMSVGMAPVIGQNWGAERYGRVHETVRYAIGFNFVWSFGVAVILALAAHSIARMFTQDPAVIEVIVLYFYLAPMTYAFANLVYGWSSIFNAVGKPQRAFLLIVVKAFVFTVPGVLIGGYIAGVKGVFLGFAMTNIVSGLLAHLLSSKVCYSEEVHHEPVTQADVVDPYDETIAA